MLIILIFFIMLIFPEIVFEGASEGLILWFQIILPTLLPFLIVSGFLLNTSAIHLIIKITSPVFCRLFGVSKYGSFAVLTGFLCGYPMGGKVTSDLYRSGKITFSEANYLISFCNNTSPMFIISYVLHQNLNASQLVVPAILILFLSPLLCSFLFRHFHQITHSNSADSPAHRISNTTTDNYMLLDECIMKSFETITKIGGYIMLFSIIIKLLSAIPYTHNFIQFIFLPFLEITNGVTLLSNSMISFKNKFIIIMALVSFGGWCSIAQTKSILSDSGLPLIPYIIEKLVTAAVTSLLASIFFQLC